jgi:hypothetical protein
VAPIEGGVAAYPGEETTCPQSLKDPFQNQSPRLGKLLPLLRHLNLVEFHADGEKPRRFRIDRKTRQRASIEKGLVEEGIIEEDDSTIDYSVIGVDNPVCAKEWRNRDSWPQVFETGEDGSQKSSPDKAVWSYSVVLATTQPKEGQAFLRIYWSVFLPVGNKPYVEIPLPAAMREISVFLQISLSRMSMRFWHVCW